jgi:signal transduction histidine kinase
VVLATAIYPMMVLDIFDEYAAAVMKFSPKSKAAILEKKSAFMWTMVLWSVGITLLVFSSIIFITHRIAGPIYKLQKYLRGIREGTENDRLYFRKGDYFMDLAQDVNLTMDSLQKHKTSDKENLEEIVAYIKNLEMVVPEDKKPVINSIVTKLSDRQRDLF